MKKKKKTKIEIQNRWVKRNHFIKRDKNVIKLVDEIKKQPCAQADRDTKD